MNQSNDFEVEALNVDTKKTQNLELLLDVADFEKFLRDGRLYKAVERK